MLNNIDIDFARSIGSGTVIVTTQPLNIPTYTHIHFPAACVPASLRANFLQWGRKKKKKFKADVVIITFKNGVGAGKERGVGRTHSTILFVLGLVVANLAPSGSENVCISFFY